MLDRLEQRVPADTEPAHRALVDPAQRLVHCGLALG
jgi:hypothetical protein